jgi:hypothetical protein
MKVWDAETGKELLALEGVGRLAAFSFSPYGIRAITESGPANFWEAVDSSLTKEEYPEYRRQRYEEWVKANLPQPD